MKNITKYGLLALIALWTTAMIPNNAQAASAKQMTDDEKQIASLLEDGDFTADEQKAVIALMTAGDYYAMRVKFNYRNLPTEAVTFGGVSRSLAYTFSRIAYAGPSYEQMRCVNGIVGGDIGTARADRAGVQVWLWRNPSEAVRTEAKLKAKNALKNIYEQILALKPYFSDLDKFDQNLATLTDDTINFTPNKPDPGQVTARPLIIVRIKDLSFDNIAYSEIFSKQRLALDRMIYIEDDELGRRIYDIITRSIEPLVNAEIALGGYPVCVTKER